MVPLASLVTSLLAAAAFTATVTGHATPRGLALGATDGRTAASAAAPCPGPELCGTCPGLPDMNIDGRIVQMKTSEFCNICHHQYLGDDDDNQPADGDPVEATGICKGMFGSSACCTNDPPSFPWRGLIRCDECYAGYSPCDAHTICPPNQPAAGCTKKSCPFSYSPNASVCGEVDAAARMPDNIWANPAAVGAYVSATIKLYNVDGVMLQNAVCNRTGKTPVGTRTASWTSPELMQHFCAEQCGCDYPACPNNPTGPGVYCSVCGPKLNQPINVTMWVPKFNQPINVTVSREETRAAEVAAATTVDEETRAAEVAAATTVDANGGNHLWFRSTDPGLGWCGEIDAAAYMPAELFEPRHILSLVAYAEATITFFTNPNVRATPLVLGKCSGIDYNKYNGILTGVSWFGRQRGSGGQRLGTLMGHVCAVQCACSFEGTGPGALPACIDLPDYPSAGRFCSLCGPSTSCPGCTDGGLITGAHPIHLFTEGPAECQPRGSACPPAAVPRDSV